jgi:CheY-like chemotaxis protein
MTGPDPDAKVVLVVDDDAVNRLVLRKMLHHRGYRVVEAADGIEAVDRARTAGPSVVLMDINMPRMTGIEAAARIAALLPAPCPRIIAVTADVSARQRAACAAAGFDGFLDKPVTMRSLFDILAPPG